MAKIKYVKWNGDNLREVIKLIGLHPSAKKWTWEEYEQVVKNEGLKVFTKGIQIFAHIGDTIVKYRKGIYDVFPFVMWDEICENTPGLQC